MRVLLPPPVVVALVGALMWFVDARVPVARIEVALRGPVVALLAGAGFVLMLLAVFALWRGGTTVDPVRPARASRLITTGVFAHTRNPVYLGDLLWLAAWAVWLGNAVSALLPLLFLLWISGVQIRAEEAALAERFGAEFDAYRARVRRWL